MDIMSTAQLLGNFGEFFGSIAVLATLIYVAVQVSQLKQQVRMQATFNRGTAARDVLLAAVNSDHLPGILNKLRESAGRTVPHQFEGLDPDESYRLSMFNFAQMKNHEMNFEHIAEEDRESMGHLILTQISQPGFDDWWTFGRTAFNRQFQQYVDSILEARMSR
jgi:hypothetical protein